jgi:hypothetical protein
MSVYISVCNKQKLLSLDGRGKGEGENIGVKSPLIPFYKRGIIDLGENMTSSPFGKGRARGIFKSVFSLTLTPSHQEKEYTII